MAERRMFAKTIVLSDAFLDMPMSARCLYFTLGMLADDDGFVNAPRSIMRQCGASDDDMKILLSKKFVILFDSGVIVIKHWRINNYLQADRVIPTKYTDEKEKLVIGSNRAYHLKPDVYTEDVYTESVYTDKNSIDKNSLVKSSIGKGEYEGGNPPEAPADPADHPAPALTAEKKKERISFYVDRLRFDAKMGYGDGECWFALAANEGITRAEIEAAKTEADRTGETP